jgi:hypothetical protein
MTELIGQFVLCKSESHIPSDWSRRQLGRWLLANHAALPVVDVLANDSTQVGWLLGYPISAAGHLVRQSVTLAASSSDRDFHSKFESSISDYGGRFAAVLLTASHARFYLDAGGTLAAVFCPVQEIVASTTALVPYTKGCEQREELVRAIGIPMRDSDAFYPFGLTPRRSVERLLPNHYLDLASWETVRFWPSQEIPTVQNVESSVAEIALILKRQVAAIAREYPIEMSLTAGRDTRVLLACAREHLDRIRFFTVSLPDSQARLDTKVARRLARRFDLDHAVLGFEEPNQKELTEWLSRTGNCVSGRTWTMVRTLKQLDSERIYFTGQGGELFRFYYWRPGDNLAIPIPLTTLLERAQVPTIAEVTGRGEQWLESLPRKDPVAILDLFMIEQYLGCWNAPQQYGHVGSRFRLLPIVHRRIIEIAWGLPFDYRLASMVTNDVIKSHWPELLQLPFNEPIGIDRTLRTVKRLASALPRKARSFLAK